VTVFHAVFRVYSIGEVGDFMSRFDDKYRGKLPIFETLLEILFENYTFDRYF